jgi:hypothetical protein
MKRALVALLISLQATAGIIINPGGGSGGGVDTVGEFSSSAQTNGASISGSTITFGPANATTPGMVSTGNQTWAGNKTLTGVLSLAAGSAASPSLNFGDSGTGLYRTGTNQLGIATSGTLKMSFSIHPTISSGLSLLFANSSGTTGNASIASNSFGTILIRGDNNSNNAGVVIANNQSATSYAAHVSNNGISGFHNDQNDVWFFNGQLKTNTTAVGNVGTGEDNLITYTLSANQLHANRTRVKITAFGTYAANGNAKTVKCYFGSTVLANSGALTVNGGAWRMEADVIRTGASAQVANSALHLSGASTTYPSVVTATTPSETLSNSLVIKCTGEATDDDDIKQTGLIVEFGQAGA